MNEPLSKISSRFLSFALPACLVLLLLGCNGNSIQRRDGQSTDRPFAIDNLAKTDIDMIAEMAQREVLAGLRRLTEKLYRRNPREYRKAGFEEVAPAVARIFDALPRWNGSGMRKLDWRGSLRRAFDEGFDGDRVHACMSALTVMVMASYGHRTRFYMTDEISAQSLYNSARNLEVAVWKLSNARRPDGSLMLLSNGMDEGARNLSFEREFGKLIAQQDLLALIIEDKSNRAINRVLHNVASFILLPV